MTVLSRSVYVLAVIDAIIIAISSFVCMSPTITNVFQLLGIVAIFIAMTMAILGIKGFYQLRKYRLGDIYLLFECVFVASFIAGILSIPINKVFAFAFILINIFVSFAGILLARLIYVIYKTFFKPVKNILIVGAGQDGKLIAEEIQSRPELGMKVVGFLDDNMNNIEEEDSSIPILGLT